MLSSCELSSLSESQAASSPDVLVVLQENIADKLGDGLHKVGDAAKNVKHKK